MPSCGRSIPEAWRGKRRTWRCAGSSDGRSKYLSERYLHALLARRNDGGPDSTEGGQMDRSDNPGNVEREMDETPVEREGMSDRGTGTDRDSMQGGGSVEREGMQGTPGTERENMGDGGSVEREGMQGTGGGSVEREGLQGGSIDRDVMEGRGNDGMMPATNADGGTSDQMMRADQREGGYGYDRPLDLTPP